jgi:uncharacterized membrane protein
MYRFVLFSILTLLITSALVILWQRQARHERRDVKSLSRLVSKIVFWASASTLLVFITGYFEPVDLLVALALSIVIPCLAVLLIPLLLRNLGSPTGKED